MLRKATKTPDKVIKEGKMAELDWKRQLRPVISTMTLQSKKQSVPVNSATKFKMPKRDFDKEYASKQKWWQKSIQQ